MSVERLAVKLRDRRACRSRDVTTISLRRDRQLQRLYGSGRALPTK